MEDKIIEPKEENLESAPVVEEEPKAEAKPEKKSIVPKIFKNHAFILVLLTFLTLVGGAFLFFVDKANAYKGVIGLKGEDPKWLTSMFNMDVTIVTWLVFAVVVIIVWFVFFTLWFRKSIRDSIDENVS